MSKNVIGPRFPAMITRIGAVDTGAAPSLFGPPKSIVRESMEFEAVVTTDAPAVMDDWDGGYCHEILVAGGGVFPARTPLLDSHTRYTVANILGAIGGFHRMGGQWIGRGQLTPGVLESENAWRMIAAGHLNSLSIGYFVNEFYRVDPGKFRDIAGIRYTAGKAPLRVSTKWTVHEVSLVAIPADAAAKIRHSAELRTDLTAPRRRLRYLTPNPQPTPRRRFRNV